MSKMKVRESEKLCGFHELKFIFLHFHLSFWLNCIPNLIDYSWGVVFQNNSNFHFVNNTIPFISYCIIVFYGRWLNRSNWIVVCRSKCIHAFKLWCISIDKDFYDQLWNALCVIQYVCGCDDVNLICDVCLNSTTVIRFLSWQMAVKIFTS